MVLFYLFIWEKLTLWFSFIFNHWTSTTYFCMWFFKNLFGVQTHQPTNKKKKHQTSNNSQYNYSTLKRIVTLWATKYLLGLVPLNPIVWCYVCYYVWHYVWLNVVINKVSLLLLSKIMVTWIFGHYHIVHEIHSMWFMWFSHRRYRSQVLCKLIILVRSRWWNWAFHLRRL